MTTSPGTDPSGDDETSGGGVDPTGVAAGPNAIEDADGDSTDATDGDATDEDA